MDNRERIKEKQEKRRFSFLCPFILYPLFSFCFLLFVLCLSSCSPTYVLRAGYEEAKILWHRRPIAEVLRRPDLDATTREKLELVLQVRRFAEKDLAFTVGG